jgi:hypothetical protein
LPCCLQPSTISSFVGGGQVIYRQALTAVVIKWQKRGGIPAHGKPATSPKRFSRFLGFIVQSAVIGEIDPYTAAKVIEGLIPASRFHAVVAEQALDVKPGDRRTSTHQLRMKTETSLPDGTATITKRWPSSS